MSEQESLPAMDDVQSDGPTEQELLDAVMRNSPIMEEAAVPLPEEEEQVLDPEESEEVEEPADEEAVSEEEEEVEEEVEDAEGEDGAEVPTQEPEVYSADDLDLEAKVVVKVDGEELEVSFGDLMKGYQTDAHLSKKGRELGEAQKALDEERGKKLEEVETIAAANNQMLSSIENSHAKRYHDLEKKIQEARDSGDTYELPELKDKREQAQQNYWRARKQREGLLENVTKQKQEYEAAQFQEQLNTFQEVIPTLISDFDEKVAGEIRDFAIENGISEGLLDSVVDPHVVKFIDDFRRLKQGVKKGVAKRKAVPAKKALPTKKAPPAKKKAADKEKMVKARAFREDASPEDQMDFLRQHASKTLNL